LIKKSNCDPLDKATLQAHNEIKRGDYNSFQSVNDCFKDLTQREDWASKTV
jgi:hypothetical protein